MHQIVVLFLTVVAVVPSQASDYLDAGEDLNGQPVVLDEQWIDLGPTGDGESPRRPLQFRAFRRHFNVTLHPAPDLISPSFTVVVRNGSAGDGEIRTDDPAFLSGCLYNGRAHIRSARRDEIESAAFNLCGRMRGIITTSGDEFFSIEPATVDQVRRRRRKRGTPSHGWHIVRRLSRSTGLGPAWSSVSNAARFLQRRSVQQRQITIETAVFIDASLYNHMMQTQFPDNTQDEITHFVLAMINAVQLLYQDESLGVPVRLQLQRLEIWTQQPLGLQLRSQRRESDSEHPAGIYNIDHYLNRFCRWQSRENPVGDNDPLHWDHALLLTGLDLFAVGRDGFTSHQIVGLAPVGGMCTDTSSCTVNEGRHFESVYVVAHELGHNLGMKHDGRAAGNDCDSSSFLMSPTLGSGKITWSPCSRNYLNAFLNTGQAQCLLDRNTIPKFLDHNTSSILPGQRFTADQQCMLRYGRESRRAYQRPLNEICRDLHCIDGSIGDGRFVRQLAAQSLTSHPALEGTLCGQEMWCRRGRCVSSVQLQTDEVDWKAAPANATSEDTWMTVSECESGCLYGLDDTLSGGSVGLSTRVRSCPPDQNCQRVSVHYQACNAIQKCAGRKKITVTQFADDVCQQAARRQPQLLLPRGTQQVSSDAGRACQVWCYLNAGGMFNPHGRTFPDGTRCHTGLTGSESKAHFCLSGRCQEFDCSNQSGRLHFESCGKTYEDVADSNAIGSEQLVRPQGSTDVASERPTSEWDVPSKPHHITSSGIAIFDVPHAKLALILNRANPAVGNRSVEPEWGPWHAAGPCRSGCLQSTQGLRLAQRLCRSAPCTGPASSVQLCEANQMECPVFEPLNQFADRVCNERIDEKRKRDAAGELIYRGVQVWPTAGQPDGGCRVHCQNSRTGEIHATSGDSGLFPSGTRCDHRRFSFCISGRCVEFDQNGIPK